MPLTPAARSYADYVVAPGLEREELLRLLRVRTGARTVLYPGCSVHVTPSRHFEHVFYVDRSELARSFFADPDAALAVVRTAPSARGGSSLRFLAADFTGPLPLPDGSMDLLLALGAGGVSRACSRYVRAGGWVFSDDHRGDALDAQREPGLRLVAALVLRGARLAWTEEVEGLLAARPASPPRVDRGPRRAGRPEYVREAVAYLFAKR